jgi:cytochrome b561
MQGEEVPFLRSMQKSHTRLAKLFHWGFIILYSYGLLKQLNDVSDLEDSRLLTFEVAFASLFLFIVLMRYFYMSNFETFLGARQPVPPIHKYLARMIHISMYVCLALLPLTGLVIAGLFAQGFKDGLMQNVAVSLHEFFASLSYLLISIHIAAAVYSRFRREGIWTAMVPILNEE